jgi:hypothetical protein
VPKLWERISVSKRARQRFDLERFELKKLDDVKVKEKYQIEVLTLIMLRKLLEKISRPQPKIM